MCIYMVYVYRYVYSYVFLYAIFFALLIHYSIVMGSRTRAGVEPFCAPSGYCLLLVLQITSTKRLNSK